MKPCCNIPKQHGSSSAPVTAQGRKGGSPASPLATAMTCWHSSVVGVRLRPQTALALL